MEIGHRQLTQFLLYGPLLGDKSLEFCFHEGSVAERHQKENESFRSYCTEQQGMLLWQEHASRNQPPSRKGIHVGPYVDCRVECPGLSVSCEYNQFLLLGVNEGCCRALVRGWASRVSPC